jgi:RNA polymerase sigma factor (sigma-70 family)
MTPHRLNPVLRHLRSLGGNPAADLPDAVLLARFVADGEEAAFTVLVRRHGPMVLGVCRRLLGDVHAAEDAFQATFLLLAKKARWLRQPDRLGPWLYGVARRVALKVRSATIRRREVAPVDVPAPVTSETHDLRPVLDAAIAGLPARYRVPVVLCYLQGLTYAEAAERLRCPVGTVATRLSRARDRLRVLLVRQGVVPPAGALTAALTPDVTAAIVPDELLRSTTRWAVAFVAGSAATIPTSILTLTRKVAQTMILDKLKILAVLAFMGLAGTGAGVALSRPTGTEVPAKPDAPQVPKVDVVRPAQFELRALPMVMLRQKPPVEYYMGAGDVLGLFIESVLGDRNSIPPIINIPFAVAGNPNPPAVGYPMVVQENGTLLLPLVGAIGVGGKSISEVRDAIDTAYQKTGVIAQGTRIMVSLARPRTYRVTVVHGADFKALDLPAYENDVLTALARSDGLARMNSEVLVIQRGSAASGATAAAAIGGIQLIRIPLKVRSDQPLPFKPEDVILKNGDVLTFESDDAQPPPPLTAAPAERPVAVTMAVAAPDGRILVQVPGGEWRMFDAAKVTATETDGKPVPAVADRLKAMTPVLVAADGRPPTGQCLQLAKAGTVVLILKD